ncbi:MAG: DUF5320 domain-containing protein [Lentisphaeria bacterium]
MPRGDGTGPMGQGPMTGRKMGGCTTGMGTGYAKAAPADKATLEQQAADLQRQLDAIKAQLNN